MLVSFLVIAAVTGPIIRKNIQSDQRTDLAKNETKNLAQSLLDPRRIENLDSARGLLGNPQRSIASLAKIEELPKVDMESLKAHLKNGEWQGNISMDPWGHPYNFAFLNNVKGTPAQVVVWSNGADGISQTSVHTQSANPNEPQFECKGDDLCNITPIR